MKLFLSIAGLACLVIIGVAAFLAHRQADRVASISLPTEATVLSKKLELKSRTRTGSRRLNSTRRSTLHKPIVRYRYEVRGEKYIAETIFPQDFEIGGNLGRIFARGPLDRFEEGQQVTAYYVPATPVEACLIRRPLVFPYVLVLLPMILWGVVVLFWPVSPERKAAAKVWKGMAVAAPWYVLGIVALGHYLYVARMDYGGGALALFALYLQLGLIPLLAVLPAGKESWWIARFKGGAIGSLVGTFLGFWAGLLIGFVVLFVSDNVTATLTCWAATPAVFAGLLGLGGFIGSQGNQQAEKRIRKKPAPREEPMASPPTSVQALSPPGPVPYGVDRRPLPESEDPEVLLPEVVGPFVRQRIDHLDEVRKVPIYAEYQSSAGKVFVELGIDDDPVDARKGVQTAQAEIEAGTPEATQDLSLDTEPSYHRAANSRGAFFAWTRGSYYFSAHAHGGEDDLDRFMQAFPY